MAHSAREQYKVANNLVRLVAQKPVRLHKTREFIDPIFYNVIVDKNVRSLQLNNVNFSYS